MVNVLLQIAALSGRSNVIATLNLGIVNTLSSVIANVLTGAALIVGGIWAYFKYAKGRTFRPRLAVDLTGTWQRANGKYLLLARITVKNVGASKVELLQKGTGMQVSTFAKAQPEPPTSIEWLPLKVFEVLKEHAWIEPGETVSDELLLDLVTPNSVSVQLAGRLVCKRRRNNIEIDARTVIPVDAE